MSDDIRDLLVEIAPEPSRRLDVDAIVAGGRRRRRARRGLAAVGALVVAVALGGSVVAVSSGGGDTPLAVRAGSPPSSISAGWTPVTVDGAGISLAIPPGWTRAAAGDVTNEVRRRRDRTTTDGEWHLRVPRDLARGQRCRDVGVAVRVPGRVDVVGRPRRSADRHERGPAAPGRLP